MSQTITGYAGPISRQGTVTLTAVGFTGGAVTWAVSGGAGNGTMAGNVYTPPATPGSYTVVATGVSNGGETASQVIVVTAAALTATTSLAKNARQHILPTGFTAGGVTWAVSGGAGNGTIDSTGFYTAPTTAGTYTVTATGVTHTSEIAHTTIVVTAAVGGAAASPYADPTIVGSAGKTQFVTNVNADTVLASILAGTFGNLSSSGGNHVTVLDTSGNKIAEVTWISDITDGSFVRLTQITFYTPESFI